MWTLIPASLRNQRLTNTERIHTSFTSKTRDLIDESGPVYSPNNYDQRKPLMKGLILASALAFWVHA
jgi:hypothetical protein